MRLRFASLLLLGAVAVAAEPAVEVFTLADGRVLTGTYDDARQRLAVVGDLRVELAVAPGQITQREPATAEAAAPAKPVDPAKLERRDRNAIATSLRQIEQRCAELERFRAASAAKADAADAGLDALAPAERAAAAGVAACDAGIGEDERTIDELKNARAVNDERITAIRARYDRDGKLVSAELTQLDRELSRIDQRLRELNARVRARAADRGVAVARVGDLAERRRDLARERDDQRRRAERAARELADNEAAKRRCERRVAELDAAHAGAPATAAAPAAVGDPSADADADADAETPAAPVSEP